MGNKKMKYKKGQFVHVIIWGQYVSAEIMAVKKGLFGYKYLCVFKCAEGGYGAKWIKESKVF